MAGGAGDSGAGAKRMVLAVKQGAGFANCPLIKMETTIGKGLEADVPAKGFLVKPVQAGSSRPTLVTWSCRLAACAGSRSTAQRLPNDLGRGRYRQRAGTQIVYRAG